MTPAKELEIDFDVELPDARSMNVVAVDHYTEQPVYDRPHLSFGQGEYRTEIKLKPGKSWRVIDAIIVVVCFIAGACLVWATLPEAMR